MSNLPLVSTVPAVITGLVAAFTAGIDTDAAYGPMKVYDGPRLQNDARNFLALAQGDPAITGTDEPQGRWDAINQGYDVNCLIGVNSGRGEEDYPAHQARVYAILGQVRAILAAQPLDPIHTRLGTAWSLTQGVYGEGTAVEYRFSIRVVASI